MTDGAENGELEMLRALYKATVSMAVLLGLDKRGFQLWASTFEADRMDPTYRLKWQAIGPIPMVESHNAVEELEALARALITKAQVLEMPRDALVIFLDAQMKRQQH